MLSDTWLSRYIDPQNINLGRLLHPAIHFRNFEQSKIPKFQEPIERFDSTGTAIVILVKSSINFVRYCPWSIF